MANELPSYLVGQKGVDLVATPLHTPDGGLLAAQNVEFQRNAGLGGIASRGGLAALNSVALAGPVIALSNIPLSYPGEIDLIVGLNQGETPTWKKSADGTTFSNLTSAQLLRPSGVDKTPAPVGAIISHGIRSASFRSQFYYAGDNYVLYTGAAGSTAPPFVVWNGTASYEQFRVPKNPTSPAGSNPYWISETWIDNGVVYFGVYDPGGLAPDQKGRVFAYDPRVGTLTQIGNRFGQDAGESTKGFPFCLTTYLGELYAGTYGLSGNNQGRIYRIFPGVDETWTVDLTATLHNGYYMSLCAYHGKLYAATDADTLGTAIIQVRTSVGAWSTSLTAPGAPGIGYFTGLIVFNDLLFAVFYQVGVTCLIKKYDGTSWTTDLDVGGTYAIKPPGLPFVYQNALYWPFLGADADPIDTTGFLLKRTTGAVWTRPLNAVGMRGCVGQYNP